VERIPVSGLVVGAVLSILILAAAGQPVSAAPPADVLPNLVADPPVRPTLDYHTYASDNSHDLLLRFDGYVHNVGAGALDVRGSRSNGADTTPMTPLQRVFRNDGSSHDDVMPNAQFVFSNADGHNHWHLQDVARYSLWNKARSAEVAPALKVGFCLGDSSHVESFGPSAKVYGDPNGDTYCERNHRDVLSLFEGVSSGWRDIYDRSLALQWVVISDVQPGSYWLREDMDPDGIVHETNEVNAPAWSASTFAIPGYVAKPIAAPTGPYAKAQHLTLASDVFGSPGGRRFRVLTPPAHGTLSVATGADLTDPAVTYTPASGYSGPDRFTYEALDSTSSYPIHPQTATVSLSVAGPPVPSVVIDSAPTSVQVGHGAQLHATVRNDLGGVTWSVDGVDGGGAGAGTITPAGFYTAPPRVPAAKHVTISARSASGAHDERVVKITVPPAPPPSPWAEDFGRPTGALLGPIGTALHRHVLVAAVTPARAGVVSIRARVGKRGLGSCTAKTPKNRRFSCNVNVPPGTGLSKLKLVATLKRHGKVVATVYRSGAPRASR
jgi:Lysyl oxidase/Bacterial Ig domain